MYTYMYCNMYYLLVTCSISSSSLMTCTPVHLYTHTNLYCLCMSTSLGTRPSLAEEEEGLVNLHTYKFEVRGISAVDRPAIDTRIEATIVQQA